MNEAWKGRRFKSKKYDKFERDALFLLPKFVLPKPPYKISYVWGFSSIASDIDNPTKMVQDILSKKYGFDDKLIHEISIKKQMVKKGSEFFAFQIESLAIC